MTGSNPQVSAAAGTQPVTMRILCLGNDLLADDSLGIIVAEQIRQLVPSNVEVISTAESGFHLLDYVLDTRRLVVVDTVVTGSAPPGTIYAFHDHELQVIPGGSPHYIGLNETLALARQLGLPVAEEVVFLAVEAADCLTLGGEVHPAVRAAIPGLIGMVRNLVYDGTAVADAKGPAAV